MTTSYGGVPNLLAEHDGARARDKDKGGGNDVQFVSLGDHCLVALYLQKFGLRNCSYPFDWIVSNVDMVKHMLVDEFATFTTNPLFYRRFVSETPIFQHHKIEDAATAAYTGRCVQRFKALAATTSTSDDKIVCFMSVTANPSFGHRPSEEYRLKDFQMILDALPFRASLLVVLSFGCTMRNLDLDLDLDLDLCRDSSFSTTRIAHHSFENVNVKHALIPKDAETRLEELFRLYT